MKKKQGLLLVALLVSLFPFFSPREVDAAQVQEVETKGQIGFTGHYEPIGTPDPAPPESIVRPPVTEIAKPGGNLPQTNDANQSWLIWLGSLLLGHVFLVWKRKKETQPTN